MNSTLLASIIVLCSSIGLGLITGLVSFSIGSESLKGVQSPPENPSQKINGEELDVTKRKKFVLKKEKSIQIRVYDQIQKHREASKVSKK